jgi:hypothetical protein
MTLANVHNRRGWLTIAALAAVGLLLLANGATRGSAADWTYNRLALTGAEENPPVSENIAGLFSGDFNATAKTFQTDLSADGGNFVAAHLHLGAKGVNGPVVAVLYNNPDGQNAFHVTVLVTPDSLVGPLKGDWDGFVKALAEGNIYANAHTSDHPGGAMRVQLPANPDLLPKTPATPAVPKPPATGTGFDASSDSTLPLAFGAVLIILAAGAATVTVAKRK